VGRWERRDPLLLKIEELVRVKSPLKYRQAKRLYERLYFNIYAYENIIQKLDSHGLIPPHRYWIESTPYPNPVPVFIEDVRNLIRRELIMHSQMEQGTVNRLRNLVANYGNLLAIANAWESRRERDCCDCYFKAVRVRAERHPNDQFADDVLQITGHLQIQVVRVPKGENPAEKSALTFGRSSGGPQIEDQGGTVTGQPIMNSTKWIKFECWRFDVLLDYLVKTRNRTSPQYPGGGVLDGYHVLYESCATLGIEAANCLLGDDFREDWRPISQRTGLPEIFLPLDAIRRIQDSCQK
jgi:hypothetical protein